uniref:Plastid light harvesting protein n=1 Tax=Chromera velia CCMP2878 TaxID=1169474 RepID=A0A0G4GSS8_9ALVE|mmetsp:Transcript_30076/g.59062  ORF Transcript_30076/g.59062 Transcript_30076/m.59062 type:complete len:247 (-) Transcript_30076:81-821(-)|eukprot:Cvel_5136.t1-p1 / transcript=Cvel_5136.t1 / gene=Cvel_5136 / organism=Chromera_velia_CCMP2878 / gene_product=Fucoxanthin-chlorophyll a-c binding protein,, putative / transcript_product=Fucoxanthin-chlorophyll a-c binding protein,, putative / location=Cvel_scaffold235:43349-45219(+) / protein_length=246 / sequence_SO=supercontig / SO=protein_coding / is_pseudo=false
MKLTVAAVACVAGASTASAFVPSNGFNRLASRSQQTSKEAKFTTEYDIDQELSFNPTTIWSEEPGCSYPTGFFDPAGFLNGCTPKSSLYRYFKEAEIKNGRLAMLGYVGYCLPYLTGNFPLWKDLPHGFRALYALPKEVVLGTFLTYLILDFYAFGNFGQADPDKYPGDVGGRFWWKGPKLENQLNFMKGREINNGRLAMLGWLGTIVQDAISDPRVKFPFWSTIPEDELSDMTDYFRDILQPTIS